MRKCTLCRHLKDKSEFYKDSYAKSGYSSACKKCRSRQISEAANLRRKGTSKSEPDPRLGHKNIETLKFYLNSLTQSYAEAIILPTWMRGAFHPSYCGGQIRRLDKGAMCLRIFRATGEICHIVSQETIEALAGEFTNTNTEILLPEEFASYQATLVKGSKQAI